MTECVPSVGFHHCAVLGLFKRMPTTKMYFKSDENYVEQMQVLFWWKSSFEKMAGITFVQMHTKRFKNVAC